MSLATLALHALAACGGRTALDESPPANPLPPANDAGIDAPADAPSTTLPGCQDAGATEIYVIDDESVLYSFYPPTLAVTALGTIACPDPGGSPNSMAVDRKGTAYVGFQDSTLFQVSTATASCTSTPYNPTQAGFGPYGMGYMGNPLDGGDTLFVANQMPGELATIDTTSFVLTVVGVLGPTFAELTGTGDGHLYAFWAPNGVATMGAAVSQIDPTTAAILATTPLPTVTQGSAWAFAFWGGSFYLFTAPDDTQDSTGNSEITRFDPTDGSVTVIATLQARIVGAGVSTCAPTR